MSRIGVFICHCGENIGATVDCVKVAELAANMEGVAYAVVINICVRIRGRHS